MTAKPRTALWIARRYLLSRRNPHASFINWVSFAGLVLGVMILTVVVSIMNGFDRELQTRLLGAVPHALAIPAAGDTTRPQAVDGIVSVTRFFQGQAMISRQGAVNTLALYATDADGVDGLDLIAERVVDGSIDELFNRSGGIVLGAPLARIMGFEIGDPVILVLSTPSSGGVRPRVERFRLAATFEVGAQPDYSLAVVRLSDLETRGLAASGVLGWRMQFADPMRVPDAVDALQASLPPGWSLQTWTDVFGDLFRAVRLEKTMMFVSLALVVAIAAFNIVSGQVMLVNDKRGDIAMLTTMGAPGRLLVEVFLFQGFSVAVLGTGVGLIAGVLIAWNAGPVVGSLEALMGASILDGTPYAQVPSEILFSDLAIIASLSLGLCFLAVLRPALKAVAENPAEALHAA